MIEFELPEPDYQDLAYYFLYLELSFTAAPSPALESAAVQLTLTGVPMDPVPFALSMKPLADGDPVSVKRTATLLAVRGTGLASAAPGWEFTRTTTRNLEGSCMLTMVVQAAAGAKVTVTGQVTARADGSFIRFVPVFCCPDAMPLSLS